MYKKASRSLLKRGGSSRVVIPAAVRKIFKIGRTRRLIASTEKRSPKIDKKARLNAIVHHSASASAPLGSPAWLKGEIEAVGLQRWLDEWRPKLRAKKAKPNRKRSEN